MLKIMETQTFEIPQLQKAKVEKKAQNVSACCTPKLEATPCCTPSKSEEENNGACCPQPADGASCCDK
jgi:hypothetical protein